MPASLSTPRRISFGPYEADLQVGELRKQGVRVRLQSQPFQLLALLLERPGQLVTRRLEDASRDCAWVTVNSEVIRSREPSSERSGG